MHVAVRCMVQSDVEMLRHKLDSQLQQLTRLTQQLAGSNAASSAGPASTGYLASGRSSNSSGSGPAATHSDLAMAGAADAAAGGVVSVEASAWHMMGNADGPGSAAGLAAGQHQSGGSPGSMASSKEQQQEPNTAGLQQQLLQQLAGLELLAEAVSLLATGQAAAAGGAAAANAADNQGGNSSFSFAAGGAATAVAAMKSDPGNLQGPPRAGPQLLRLRGLLQTGQVGCKMDWFDPVLLQKMVSSLLIEILRVR